MNTRHPLRLCLVDRLIIIVCNLNVYGMGYVIQLWLVLVHCVAGIHLSQHASKISAKAVFLVVVQFVGLHLPRDYLKTSLRVSYSPG